MSDNQELQREESATAIIAVLAGLALLFTLVRCTPIWDTVSSKIEGEAVAAGLALGEGEELSTSYDEVNPSTTDSKALADAESDLDDANERIESLEDEVAGLEKTAKKSNRDADSGAENAQSSIAAVGVGALGASGVSQAELDTAKAEAKSLQLENDALLQKTAELEGKLSATESDVPDNQALVRAKENLEAQNRKLATEITKLRQGNENLSGLQAENMKLAQQLEDARAQHEAALARAKAGSGNRTATAEARRLAAQLEAEKAAKEAAEAKLAAANKRAEDQPSKPQFVESADDLLPKAGALYKGLRGAHLGEGQVPAGANFEAKYDTLKATHGASLRRRVLFATGATGLDPKTAVDIGSLADGAQDSVYLIVGYADTTGTAEVNRRISRERSLSVAQALLNKGVKSKAVQAVFLGSTNKFGDLPKNRCVEVWQIAK